MTKIYSTKNTQIDYKVCTNEVLQQRLALNQIIYYLPCYIKFKVNSISEVDISGSNATIRGQLYFCLYYGNISQDILCQFTDYEKDQKQKQISQDQNKKQKQIPKIQNDQEEEEDEDAEEQQGKKSILLQQKHGQTLQLKQDKDITVYTNYKKHTIQYFIRKEFICGLSGQLFLTPFEIINLYIDIKVAGISLHPQENKEKQIMIKFNCMDNQHIKIISHTNNDRFANYRVASSYVQAKYNNTEQYHFKSIRSIFNYCCNKTSQNLNLDSQIKQQNQQQTSFKQKKVYYDNYQCAHFRIPLYRDPLNSIFSIFQPLLILAFINTMIFFQQTDLFRRIANIVTISLALVFLIPSINKQIPKTPKIKLIDIIIYLQALATILCLLQSFYGNNSTDQYIWQQDGFFLAVLAINSLIYITVSSLFSLHYACWDRMYTQESQKKYIQGLGVRQHWQNKQCDKSFSNRIKNSLNNN